MGLFSKSKETQAEEIGIRIGQLVNRTVAPLMHEKMLLRAVEKDPFTAGYLQAKIMEMILLESQGRGFGRSELNIAGLVALQQIFGADATTAGFGIKDHAAVKLPEFVQGRQRAAELLRYQTGQRSVSSDPMYAVGVERAKTILNQMHAIDGAGLKKPTDDDVALALELIAFGDRVVAM